MADVTITKTKPADVALPSGHLCSSCGSPGDVNDKYCAACGLTITPSVLTPRTLQPAAANRKPSQLSTPDDRSDGVRLKTFRCQNCSAEITVDPSSRSYVCPFCDSTYVVELEEVSDRQRPEFVVGFSVTPEQAWEKFAAWTRQGSLFRPLDLRKVEMPDKLRGVYLPFWSFSMLAQAAWAAEIGEHWYRTESYTVTVNGKSERRTRQVQETEWWPLAGKFHHYYYGYLVSGSKGLAQPYADAIRPFHVAAAKRYEPYFLAGWLSEEYTIARDAALQTCQSLFTQFAHRDIEGFLPGDTHRSVGCHVEFDHVNSDLILLPVYLLNYQYKGKPYHFVLNGQTGKVFGERPLSWTRILFYAPGAVLTGVAIGLIIQWFR